MKLQKGVFHTAALDFIAATVCLMRLQHFTVVDEVLQDVEALWKCRTKRVLGYRWCQ